MQLVFLYNKPMIKAKILETFKDSILVTKPVSSCHSILLRWGNTDGPDKGAQRVLNRKRPLKNCLDKKKAFEILGVNKIRRPKFVNPGPGSRYPLIAKYYSLPTDLRKNKVITEFNHALESEADFFVQHIDTMKKYNVYIFDLNIFLITKKIPVKSNSNPKTSPYLWEYEEVPKDLDIDTIKVGLLSLRSLHVLGLDFGLVHAAIDVYGRPTILDVSPVPELPPKGLELFHEQVKGFVKRELQLINSPKTAENTNPFQTTLFNDYREAEPQEKLKELRILLGADPEFLLRDSHTGALIYASDYLKREGHLGYDERSVNREGRQFPLAEIRPSPDFCPLQLTQKIKNIMLKANSILPPHVEWLAGSFHFDLYQIGGHIHFSNISINSRLMRSLDNYLGLPIMLIENPVTASIRRRQYGWLGSVRFKPHGGFEYRTPGSWLISPELTLSCLCLAKIVATEYISLQRDYLVDPELQRAFYHSKKHYFYDIFDDLWKDIKNTSLYSRYADYLKVLTDIIYKRSHWDENVDLRKSWSLETTRAT